MCLLECVYFIEESDQEFFDNALIWHHAHHTVDTSNTATSQPWLNLHEQGNNFFFAKNQILAQ